MLYGTLHVQVILGDFQVTFGIQQFWHGRKNSFLRLVPQLHSELMSLDLSLGRITRKSQMDEVAGKYAASVFRASLL